MTEESRLEVTIENQDDAKYMKIFPRSWSGGKHVT